ncbi:MAG: hypothetical protein ACOCYP_09080 [Planctomycetota bacterium]
MHRPLCCILTCLALCAANASDIAQDFKRDEALWLRDPAAVAAIATIVQQGRVKRYSEEMLADGVHIETGAPTQLSAAIRSGNSTATTLIGVHGPETELRFTGSWQADLGADFPMLVLRDGARMTWEPQAHLDFVMDRNFFTRQLWVWGDGSGTLELAPGFVSDRTEDAQVADAMGTIRLGGVTLLTHHSHSLPYNSRPDGRGGIYHNGHIVFEGATPSRWVVSTNAHHYAAQVDFATDGTIECRAPLTHHGQVRDCLAVGNGGPFVSSGAFRTTREAVTITKTGPAMLSLEGQQGYRPGARLVVAEGLLRIHSDPGAGDRYDDAAGVHLALTVAPDARVLIAAPLVRLARLELAAGATMWVLPGCQLTVAGEQQIDPAATVVHEQAED